MDPSMNERAFYAHDFQTYQNRWEDENVKNAHFVEYIPVKLTKKLLALRFEIIELLFMANIIIACIKYNPLLQI